MIRAHFPIIVNLIDKGKGIEIKNFLGEKIVRTIKCLEGVVITRTEEEKSYSYYLWLNAYFFRRSHFDRNQS